MKIQIEDADLRKLLDDNEALKKRNRNLERLNYKLLEETALQKKRLSVFEAREKIESGKDAGWYFYEAIILKGGEK